MNQEQTQNVFIGLLAAGLIMLGGGMYLISQQVKSVATSVKGIQQGVAQLQAAPILSNDVTEASGPRYDNSASSIDFGLSFDYPRGWFVSTYIEEMDQRKAVRLTSSEGRLFLAESSGGPGESGVTYFQEGFQMNVVPLLGDPSELEGSSPTKYSNVLKAGPCDGAGCPVERYIFVDAKGVGRYEIRFTYTEDPYYQIDIDRMLSSMKLSS